MSTGPKNQASVKTSKLKQLNFHTRRALQSGEINDFQEALIIADCVQSLMLAQNADSKF